MKVKDKKGWAKCLKANKDPYGLATVRYAECWADLMERQLAKGKTIKDCAKATSHEADTDGITGFMYGCAVSILAQVWEHGEELRQWHNLDVQIDHEGEEANRKGKTLNPALVNIG